MLYELNVIVSDSVFKRVREYMREVRKRTDLEFFFETRQTDLSTPKICVSIHFDRDIDPSLVFGLLEICSMASVEALDLLFQALPNRVMSEQEAVSHLN